MAHSIQDQLLELSILLFIIGSALEKLLGCVIILVKWQSVSAYCLKCIFIKQITVKVLPNSFCHLFFFLKWVFKVFITKNYINTCTTHYFCIVFVLFQQRRMISCFHTSICTPSTVIIELQ